MGLHGLGCSGERGLVVVIVIDVAVTAHGAGRALRGSTEAAYMATDKVVAFLG
jgi:hypothetical protein